MKNILRIIIKYKSVVCGYFWLFVVSGFILFNATLILPGWEGLTLESDARDISAYLIIIVGLYIIFLFVNHYYIKNFIDKKCILFVETLLTISLVFYAALSVCNLSSLYGEIRMFLMYNFYLLA